MSLESGIETKRIIGLEAGWEELKSAIDKLKDALTGGADAGAPFQAGEFMACYTTCYDMCTQRSPYNWSADLYRRLGEEVDQYLTQDVLPSLREKSGGISLLTEIQYRWANHLIMKKWLRNFFLYLDRFHVKHHSLDSLNNAAIKSFKRHVYEEVKTDMTNAILRLINEERDGEIIDKSLIKSIVELYESIGLESLDSYTVDLEEAMLRSTKEYYSQKRNEWINSDSTPDYLIKVEQVFYSEKARVSDYLNGTTESKLSKVCEEELLEEVQNILLEKEGSGCKVLLANNKSADLQRMFRLFSRIDNGLNPMAAMVGQFISSLGLELIDQRQARLDEGEKDKNDDPNFIKALLSLHDKYLNVIKQDFSGHSLFQKALKDAFVEFVNKNVGQYTNAELLSSFCDRVLRSGGEKMSDAELEDNLDRVVQLFSYLTDKDMFADFYRTQLAKRLLNQRSLSDDAEKSMIAKLKIQCGTHFTSKMEGMLADLAVGTDSRSEFDKTMKENKATVDFSAQILTTGFWPTYPACKVSIPASMSSCMNLFKKWHDGRHAQRKLVWQYTLGNANVRATFGKKTYDLIATTLQAVTILALNNGVKMSYTELADQLNIEEHILKPLLHSLCCTKHKVVSKSPANNKINSTDSFMANPKFSSNMRKIRLLVPAYTSSNNNKKVEKDRTHAIDAVIVRIMKARKTLQHQQLISEVLKQLAFFKPTSRNIKKRIEVLIDREYLERSSSNNNVYNYLA